jgi:hypothetical protein
MHRREAFDPTIEPLGTIVRDEQKARHTRLGDRHRRRGETACLGGEGRLGRFETANEHPPYGRGRERGSQACVQREDRRFETPVGPEPPGMRRERREDRRAARVALDLARQTNRYLSGAISCVPHWMQYAANVLRAA